MATNKIRSIFNNLLAAAVSLIMFIPVYLVFVNSLKTKAEASSMGIGLPSSLNWSNFATVASSMERAAKSSR